MEHYYIVGNRAFATIDEAIEYCEANDFEPLGMIAEMLDGVQV